MIRGNYLLLIHYFSPILRTIQHILIILSVCNSMNYFGQKSDTVKHELFKNRVVLFADLGFNSAPFSLQDNYLLGVNKLDYKNNIRAVLGIGGAYKWFALRIGYALPGNLKSKSEYGNTEYFDVGLRFNIKRTFTNVVIRSYKGYAIKNAYEWNDTLDLEQPNAIMPNVSSTSISANVWYFISKEFKMQAVDGKVGHYTGAAKTWYFKTSLNLFGISNDTSPLIPEELRDSTIDRHHASSVGAIDLGLIPGYAYVNRIKNWQFAVFGGFGGVLQSKFYTKGQTSRGYLGIAPRIDIRFIVGYSKPKYFIMLTSDFDIKSLQIQNLKYNQTYYNLKIIGGFRFHTKKSRQKDWN